MAFRCMKLLRIFRNSAVRSNLISTNIANKLPEESQLKGKGYKTEDNFIYLEDPDTFGTLSGKMKCQNLYPQDQGDIKEEQYTQNIPLQSQKLTIKQYADLIKQYLKHKRLKEAIDILEVRMLKNDRVKPENYIYNILIGACADVGYTKKAFKLFNDMKRRALQPTGDTYTCLFHACVNSPWPLDGLKCAQNLRLLMIEKGIEPNLTNYNAMIKAFGRCGDLATAFKIVDEMISKNIKIRVHTFNHLLHACITEKNTGLRHALVVWRKMLKMREKPNIYSFNLMLKCVKECNLGSKEDIEELIGIIQEQIALDAMNPKQTLHLYSQKTDNLFDIKEPRTSPLLLPLSSDNVKSLKSEVNESNTINNQNQLKLNNNQMPTDINTNNLAVIENNDISIKFVDNLSKPSAIEETRTVPNLLSRVLNMDQVLALQETHTVQDRFAVIGGQDDFLKEMQFYSVEPDIKTFTQMLSVIDDTREAENKLIDAMKQFKLKPDIDFFNMLIKKRCLRSDYDGAFAVRDIIAEENKIRKKKHPMKKKLQLKFDIMTYGTLAMACKTKDSAEKLLNEMKDNKLKINIEILGTLLKNGVVNMQFEYVLYIMNIVKEENIKVNDIFINHLEMFTNKCSKIMQDNERKTSATFAKMYKTFLETYNDWLKKVNVEEALKPEHPWSQFREPYPETVQKQNIKIVEPKRFYKRNKKFVVYRTLK